ncbi:MAG: hypothetical protein IK038_02065 [Bacteroidaceae bacterium]|nr:hypothetical protein [Bacteroidaceae bacterium]
MLKRIIKWLATRKEHREDFKVCKSYWRKDVKVIGDTLAYWDDEGAYHQWIPFIKGMPYAFGRPITNMRAKSMSVTVVNGLGINNLLYALVFFDASVIGNTKVFPLLILCSHKRGIWTQPVHSAESLLALVGKKQNALIRRNSRLNWNMAEIV